MDKPTYLYHATLKKRPGWSDKVIAHFLPEPCATRQNPHYRSAAPTRLYKIARVEQIEAQSDWQQQAIMTNRRKQSADLATKTKQANLLAYVDRLTIRVPIMDVAELTDLACAHYNSRKAWRNYEHGTDDFFQSATPDSDKSFLSRITTNYLRHMLTRYEDELKRIAGKVGVDEAYLELKKRVNDAIYKQYPHLANVQNEPA